MKREPKHPRTRMFAEPGLGEAEAGVGNPELLPDELLWAEGGHASDVVLTCLADGEHAIVPKVVRSHVERCEACMVHLGHAALLSLHSDRDLRHLQKPAPLPRVAIALGLAAAFLGLVPSLVNHGLSHMIESLPLYARGLTTLVHKLEPGVFTTYAAALTLFAMGIAAVRFLPKKETSR
jgi:hypothetical protein